MKLDHPGRFAMLRGTLLEVPQQGEMRLACAAGELWVTQDHDLRDIVLRPRESFTTDRGRRVLVSALEDSVLEVQPAARPEPVTARGWRPVALPA